MPASPLFDPAAWQAVPGFAELSDVTDHLSPDARIARIAVQSPAAIRVLTFAFNAVDDGMVGQQVFAGEAARLTYGTGEAAESRNAFLGDREPDWSPFPWAF